MRSGEYFTDGGHRFWYGNSYGTVEPVMQVGKFSDGSFGAVVLTSSGRMTGNILARFKNYPTVFQLAEVWEGFING